MSDFETDEGYEDAADRSSIAAPLLRALFFAGVAFAIYALIFGGDAADDVALDEGATAAVTAPEPTATPTPVPLDAMPTATPAPTATGLPTDGASPAVPATPGADGQVGAGVSVQVIAGSGTTQAQFADAVSVLGDLGYEVIEAGISPNPYPQTTVFATAGEEAQAQALVAADERFTTVAENPGTLTDQIQIHVLVGEDWPV